MEIKVKIKEVDVIKAIGKEVEVGKSLELDYESFDESRKEKVLKYLNSSFNINTDDDEDDIDELIESIEEKGIHVYSKYSGVRLYVEGAKIYAY